MLSWTSRHGSTVYRRGQSIYLQCHLPLPSSPHVSLLFPTYPSHTRPFVSSSQLAAKKITRRIIRPHRAATAKSQSTVRSLPVRRVLSTSNQRIEKLARAAASRKHHKLWRGNSASRLERWKKRQSSNAITPPTPSAHDVPKEQRTLESLSGQLSLEDALNGIKLPQFTKALETQDMDDPKSKGRKTRTKRRIGTDEDEESSMELKARDIQFQAIDVDTPPVPKLAHGLQKVLFNRGVYQFRDLHSRVYNFDPSLELITPLTEIDFNSLKGFIPSSEDTSLARIAIENGKRYTGSTSSMTGILKHLHFLLSKFRAVNMDMLSIQVRDTLPPTFTKITAAPEAVFLKWRNGTYAIDSDKEFSFSNILSFMGRYMEKLLTVDREAFERYKRDQPNPITGEELKADESHHYSAIGDILMRSQLDAHDPRLPGTGMFDLKTRAVIPIRMDSGNPEPLVGYELRDTLGAWESYEREYADMMRSTLLKYSLQARMGRMDGIFVAYHNITRLFGFQYMSINEMDLALHGQSDRTVGDTEFLYSVHILNRVLNEATAKFPEQSLRIHFETRERTARTPLHMDVYAEPVTDDEMKAIQTSKQAAIEEWERKLLHPDAAPAPAPDTPNSTKPAEDTDSTAATPPPQPTPGPAPDRDILHLRLTAHSLQAGARVLRPANLTDPSAWTIRYALTSEPDPAAARKAYTACRGRRKTLLDLWARDSAKSQYFTRMLRTYVDRGREWRKRVDALDAEDEQRRGGVLVWDSEVPVKREAGRAGAGAGAGAEVDGAPAAVAAAAGGGGHG